MNMQLPPELAAQMQAAQGQAPAQPKEPYAKYLRTGLIAGLLLVFGVFGWAALTPIKGAVVGTGVVEVAGKPKTIQHLDGGIIGEILVSNGQSVKAGETLIRLDPTLLDVNREIVDVQLNETLARVTRLQAERDNKSRIIWPERLINAQAEPRVARAMDGQLKLFEARRQASFGQVRQLSQRIEQLENQIDGLGALMRSKEAQKGKIVEEARDKRTLVEKGFLGKPAVLALEREELRLAGDIENHRAEVARLQGSILETREQISQLRRDRQSEVLTELRAAETETTGFREQLTAASAQSDRIAIVSPVNGTVHNLQVTTNGGVVTPGQELMQIIPDGANLIVIAQIQPVDVDQVYPGQDARVRFSAFNARRTPELNAKVVRISPNSIIDPVTGFPYFEVEVFVSPEEMDRLSSELVLVPGMPAETFMQTGERSVLSYLIKPAEDAVRRAGREE